jgi:putative protein-disulfide isomerase
LVVIKNKMKKVTFLLCSFWLLTISCYGQTINNKKMTETRIANPLLCDPETGVCEMPKTATPSVSGGKMKAQKKPIKIVYFTDPICSSCWGIEPQLRRMKLEYGHAIEIEYHMGGLLPDWSYNSGGISKPSDVAHHWDEVSLHYDMPIDGDVWLEDPLPSSFPPSIAVKAAQLQDEKRAIAFMRRIKEMVFLEKKNITKWEHIEKAAAEVGLDTAQLRIDFNGKAAQDFQNDLALARQLGVRGFPTLFFTDTLGNKLTAYGVRPYAQFEQNIKALLPDVQAQPVDITPKALFAHYPTLTTKEFSVLAGISTDTAQGILTGLFEQQLLQKYMTKNGVLWIGKSVRY